MLRSKGLRTLALLFLGTAFARIATAEPPALLPEPDGIPKNRFISFSFLAVPKGTQWAVRVKLVKLYNTDANDPVNEACPVRGTGCGPAGECNLRFIECTFDSDCPPPLSTFDGQVRWAGPPEMFPDGDISGFSNFLGAALQCCPGFRDWRGEMVALRAPQCSKTTCSFDLDFTPCTVDDECPPAIYDTSVLHVFGPEILPCSQYEVQLVDVSCEDLSDENCYSEALTIHTGKWGDVVPNLGGRTQPNFMDIAAEVDKFKRRIPPKKVQALLAGNCPFPEFGVTYSDISLAVRAFKRLSYLEEGPSGCVEPCE